MKKITYSSDETLKKITYDSNNSGGDWWLKDEHWHALEAAGWTVHWAKDKDYTGSVDKDGRWLGALATSASKEFASVDDAVFEWEGVTGQCASDQGCSCCGTPHSFHDDDYNYYERDTRY